MVPVKCNSSQITESNALIAYSGKSTLALVARAYAFSFGLFYGSIKLKFLKAKAKSHQKAAEKACH